MTAVAALAVAAVCLTGCVGASPEPTPTPTAVFASEEEAFAAAEETYRAYIDADNARRSDPQATPDPEAFLIGAALEREIDSRREFAELGIRLVGDSVISSVDGISADLRTGDVVVHACYDSTNARVVNEGGEDVTVADRDPTVMIEVDLTQVADALLISNLSPVEGDQC